jgi:hypothetical protein
MLFLNHSFNRNLLFYVLQVCYKWKCAVKSWILIQLKGFPLHSPFIRKCRVATTIQQQMVGTIYLHCLVTASRDLHIQIL